MYKRQDEEDKIIDLLKRFSLEENRLRALFPGLKYEQPVIEEKISPLNITEEEFNKFKNENSLLKNIEGLGKLTVQNITDFNSFTHLLNTPSQPKIFLNKGRDVYKRQVCYSHGLMSIRYCLFYEV